MSRTEIKKITEIDLSEFYYLAVKTANCMIIFDN